MVKDLDKFYECTKMLDKQISIYEDEEGNYTVLPTTALLVNVDYNEFEKDQYNVAVFNGDIPKDFTTETKTIKKPVPKYDITKKPEDKYTLTEKEVAVKPVWFIINGAKVKKAFNNKEEALKQAKKINKKVIDKLSN